ncbi:hydrolase [Nostoc sp. 3335mG]|nr:hydrolase [Nostoc sp. 3335mG]
MALTLLDANTALLVVDLQKGLLGAPLADPIDGVLERAAELIRAFCAHGLPVVLINVAGTAPGRTEQPRRLPGELPEGFTDFVPELDRQPGDMVVTKRTWGAFAGTDLETRLKALGVTQVIVIGVATGTGVESTARQAYEAGFNVTLAIDAMTDMRAEAHAYSIGHIFPRLGETGTTRDVIALLARRGA